MSSSTDKIIYLENGLNKIPVKIRKSEKAKNIRISLSSYKGVELIVPQKEAIKHAISFLLTKEEAIRAKLESFDNKIRNIQHILEIPIFDRSYLIEFKDTAKKIALQSNKVIIPSKYRTILDKALKKFLTDLLYKEIIIYIAVHSYRLKVTFNKITLKEIKSIWGSCSNSGNLSFSWRIVFAPHSVIEYLVVHELCHLIQMNHSSKFWSLVKNTYPQYEVGKEWLRKNGHILHQILPIQKA